MPLDRTGPERRGAKGGDSISFWSHALVCIGCQTSPMLIMHRCFMTDARYSLTFDGEMRA